MIPEAEGPVERPWSVEMPNVPVALYGCPPTLGRTSVQAFKAAVEHVRKHGYNEGSIARVMGMGIQAVRRNRARNYVWREELEAARLEFLAQIEREAMRRAVDGWEETRMGPGGVEYSVRKYSDQLLIELLRANGPDKYGNKVQIENKTTIEVKAIGFDTLPLAARLKMLDFINEATPKEVVKDAEFTTLPPSPSPPPES